MPLDPDPRLAHLLDPAVSPTDAALGAIARRRRRMVERRLKRVSAAAVVMALAASGVAAASFTTNPPAPSHAAGPEIALRPGGANSLVVAPPAAGAAPVSTTPAKALPSAVGGLSWSRIVRRQPQMAAASSSAAACGGDGCAASRSLSRVFSWTYDQVSVRAYVSASPGDVAQSGQRSCPLSKQLILELSDPAAVGTLLVPETSTHGEVDAASVAVIGAAENGAVEIVGLHVGPDVTSVTASFASGTSEVATPKSGWVALVDPTSGPRPEPVRIEALGAGHAPLGTISLPARAGTAVSTACLTGPRTSGG